MERLNKVDLRRHKDKGWLNAYMLSFYIIGKLFSEIWEKNKIPSL